MFYFVATWSLLQLLRSSVCERSQTRGRGPGWQEGEPTSAPPAPTASNRRRLWAFLSALPYRPGAQAPVCV